MIRPLFHVSPFIFIAVFNAFFATSVIANLGLAMMVTRELGADDTMVGALGASLTLGYAAMAWFGGRLADRIPHRALMTAGLLILAATHAGFAVTRVFPLILLFALVSCVGAGGLYPSLFAMLGERLPPRTLSRAIGLNGIFIMAYGMFAALGVGRIYERWGGGALFGGAAALAFALAVFCWLVSPDAVRAEPDAAVEDMPELKPPSHAMAVRMFILGITLNLSGLYISMIHQIFLPRLAELPRFHLDLQTQSNIQGARLFAGLLGYAAGAFIPAWKWRLWPFAAMVVLFGAATVLTTFAPDDAILGIGIMIGGFTTSFTNQMSVYYAVNGQAIQRGRGGGLSETAFALGGGLGPVIAGWLATRAGTPLAAMAAPAAPLVLFLVVAMWAAAGGLREKNVDESGS